MSQTYSAPSAGVGAAALAANVDRKYRPDWWLFLVTIILLSFGIIMVFDASYPNAIEHHHGNKAYWVIRQVISAVAGLIGMALASRVRFWKWQVWGLPFLIAAFGMLVAVRFIGHGALGAQRWIGVGQFRIQPSEIAKVALVFFMAQQIAQNPRRIRDFWKGYLPLVVIALASVGLVERQPDLGTAITMLLTVVLVLFAGGAKKRWIAGTLAVCAIAAFGLIMVKGKKDNFRFNRLITFVHPEYDPLGAGFQITHSTVALGSGGITGVGFGESREKRQGGLPAQRTDFIFAIVGEEFGLVGTLGVLTAFMLLAARGFHIAQRTKDPFGSLLAVGLTGMVAIQALLNVAVVTASIPTTGIPLPFVSYGGTSLVITLFGIGVLLNISQYPFRRDMRPAARRQRGDEVASDEGTEPVARPRAPRYHEGV